ncbi:hypothetical protein ACP4OV_021370 [Aristida adscensionis]
MQVKTPTGLDAPNITSGCGCYTGVCPLTGVAIATKDDFCSRLTGVAIASKDDFCSSEFH